MRLASSSRSGERSDKIGGMSKRQRRAPFREAGLLGVVTALFILMSVFAGSYVDRNTGQTISTFLNPGTLLQVATETAFFAIIALGMLKVMLTGGIDLSVGATYALCGIAMGLAFRDIPGLSNQALVAGLLISVGVGVACGFANGVLVSTLKVHPFMVTLGTMWIFRGIAFVSSKAVSLPLPLDIVHAVKASLFLPQGLSPIPMLVLLLMLGVSWFVLGKTVWGRNLYAMGGNSEAAFFSGINLNRTQIAAFTFAGLCCGIAALLGNAYYGSASSGDANGYELYIIASAVVGGTSLSGGRGTPLGVVLGALLIVLLRQSIRTFHFDQNYEWIIIGTAIIAAVAIDRFSQQQIERRFA